MKNESALRTDELERLHRILVTRTIRSMQIADTVGELYGIEDPAYHVMNEVYESSRNAVEMVEAILVDRREGRSQSAIGVSALLLRQAVARLC
jgi:hypothetical protein